MSAFVFVTCLIVAQAGAEHAKNLKVILNDGHEMPQVGLGTWKSPAGQVEEAVRHAICHADYRHIDAAHIYGNQQEVGRAIRHAIEKCGVKRTDLWVTSKIWNVDFQHVPEAADKILQDLGLDYVDQLLLHWPTPYKKPPAGCPPVCPAEFAGTDDVQRPRGADGMLVLADVSSYPLSQTWQELERVRDSGKVRSIGVSNFSPEEIDGLAVGDTTTVPAVNQVEAHVFWNQARLRQEMHDRGILLVAYSPLGNPAVYGSQLDGMKSSLISEIAAEAKLTPAQVMLNYLVSLGDVVVPKSVTMSRIDSNLNFTVSLTRAQITRLSKEAPQSRMANPKNRQGGKPVFADVEDSADAPSIVPQIILSRRVDDDEL